MEGNGRDDLENKMVSFLQTKIHVLWPEGWMSVSTLQRLCNIYCEFRNINKNENLQNKSTKNVLENIPNSQNVVSTSANKPITITVDSPISSSKILKELPVLSSSSGVSITPIINNSTDNELNYVSTQEGNDRKEVSNRTHSIDEPTKTSNLLTITPANYSCNTLHQKQDNKYELDLNSKQENSQHLNIIESKSDNNICQIINLVDSDKKMPSKLSPKYCEDIEAVLKPKEIIVKPKQKNDFDKQKSKKCEEKLDTLAHTSIKLNSNKMTDYSIKKLSSSSNFKSSFDYSKPKICNERDDIQKVMEGLKNLQKMSSPVKQESSSSSPVSVIAYNKTNTPKTCNNLENFTHSSSLPPTRSDYNKTDFGPGFQEAFQRQLFGDFSLVPSTISSTTKEHYSSG